MEAGNQIDTASAVAPVEPLLLKSLREHVHERLRSLIISGRFAEGERLHERELAELLGISTTPVKDAFRMLESEGLVRIEARRGVFVLFGPRRAYEMAMARAAIEGMIAGIAARRIDDAGIAVLGKLVTAMEIATQRGDLDETVTQNAEFHGTIAAIARCEYLLSRLEGQQMYDHARRIALLRKAEERQLGFIEHKAIFVAIAARDSARADAEMRQHILRSARHFLNSVFNTGLKEEDYVD